MHVLVFDALPKAIFNKRERSIEHKNMKTKYKIMIRLSRTPHSSMNVNLMFQSLHFFSMATFTFWKVFNRKIYTFAVSTNVHAAHMKIGSCTFFCVQNFLIKLSSKLAHQFNHRFFHRRFNEIYINKNTWFIVLTMTATSQWNISGRAFDLIFMSKLE